MSIVTRMLKSAPSSSTGVADSWQNPQVAQFVAIDNVFSSDECQRIISLGEQQQSIEGKISKGGAGGAAEDFGNDDIIRKSEVRYLHPDDASAWIFDKMEQVVNFVNQHYRFNLQGFEDFQFASYEEGGHYDWHIDVGAQNESSRKLSISLQLSAPNEYEGGGLEFFGSTAPVSRNQGAVIIFPAFLAHRVVPVTSGKRHAIVAWVHGPAFS